MDNATQMWRNAKGEKMGKVVVWMMMLMLMLTSCGGQTEEAVSDVPETDTIVEQEVPEVEPQPEVTSSPLEGKWVDEAGITELIVEGNKAVLNGRCMGTANGEELDFPNDYKETKAEFIDGNLYLTFTILDSVAEQTGVPKDHTITVMLTKVEE